MSTVPTSPWLHSNRYSADKACEHCEGLLRHESWCITNSELIRYAYQVLHDASKLGTGDLLHALGVRWADNSAKRQACACTYRETEERRMPVFQSP
jgi:hypothetical protein